MKFLIDTCVISELIKPAPNKNVMKWISSKNEEELFLSVLSFGELKKGIEKLKESKRKRELANWLYELESRFNKKILDIDKDIAEIWGKKMAELEKKGISMPSIDSLIASTAIAKNLIVATRNEKDIKDSGVEIINPWK